MKNKKYKINTPLEGALIAAELGIPVFPCNTKTKKPLVKDWPNIATSDSQRIKNMWNQYPNAMIGAVTGKASGYAVIDIDVKDDISAEEKLAILEKAHGNLNPQFVTKTPSGGIHLWFKVQPDTNIQTSAGKIAPCIDVRGTGGYAIFAGSVRADGQPYQMAECQTIVDSNYGMPPSLIKACQIKSSTNHQGGSSKPSFTGRRNTTLTSIAGSLRARGLGEDAIHSVIRSTNEEFPNPLSENEVANISRSISRYEVRPNTFTHSRFADHLAIALKGHVLYCENKGWSIYKQGYWQLDPEKNRIMDMARSEADRIKAQILGMREEMDEKAYIQLTKAATKMENLSFIQSSVKLLQTDPKVLFQYESFNPDFNLLNLANGVLNLETRQLSPHDPSYHMNYILPVDYASKATCPEFDKFLADILPQEVGQFVLRAIAYSMQGHAKEQCFFVLQGAGKNGKSTLMDTLGSLFGELAVTVYIVRTFGTNCSLN